MPEVATTRESAAALDARDPLAKFRDRFHHPRKPGGEPMVYLVGHSLGLEPKTFPATLVFDHPTPLAVARLVVARLYAPAAQTAAAPTNDAALSVRRAEIESLSDDEAEALLLAKLEGLSR